MRLSLSFCTATVVATCLLVVESTDTSNIPAGNRLLEKARRRTNQNQDDAVDFSWISGYSIRYHSCHTTLEFRADAGGGSADENGEDASPMEQTQLIHFRLCPSTTSSCGACRHGGDYVVELREYMESYMELQQDQLEYDCEAVENSCSCDGDDDCLQNCYAEAGLECNNDNENNDDDFELEQYMECRALNDDNDDNYYGQRLYVGPYCGSNGGVYLGTFTDRQCTVKASKNAYQNYVGQELPYSRTSIISKDCMSCLEPTDDDDNNNNNNNGDDVKELCEELYERSAKCERHLKGVDYTTNGGCEFMYKLMPQMERIAKHRVAPSSVFAWLFFLSTVGLAAWIGMQWKKTRRSQVSLVDQGGVVA